MIKCARERNQVEEKCKAGHFWVRGPGPPLLLLLQSLPEKPRRPRTLPEILPENSKTTRNCKPSAAAEGIARRRGGLREGGRAVWSGGGGGRGMLCEMSVVIEVEEVEREEECCVY